MNTTAPGTNFGLLICVCPHNVASSQRCRDGAGRTPIFKIANWAARPKPANWGITMVVGTGWTVDREKGSTIEPTTANERCVRVHTQCIPLSPNPHHHLTHFLPRAQHVTIRAYWDMRCTSRLVYDYVRVWACRNGSKSANMWWRTVRLERLGCVSVAFPDLHWVSKLDLEPALHKMTPIIIH